ncbi:4'-phosphopantetheinyl transferase superfamily protein [Micromonospora sp. NPDC049101]|uniref:4'-phosphopantetheinyl transferase superfamily protein n=1 Tax=Micromonospora sp. NPDC049101 TaxID=3155032 RepID=UPI00340F97C1
MSVTVVIQRTDRAPREAARALLLRTVSDRTGRPIRTIEVAHEPGGRPYLTGIDLHVSVSHTRGAVAVALSTRAAVGVDVEPIRPLPVVALARRWLPPVEAEWLTAQPEDRRVAAFLRLWTVKEAIGKAHGRGLGGGSLLRRPVQLPEGDTALRPVPDFPGTVVATPGIGDGLVLAVACHGGDQAPAEVTVRHEAAYESSA